MARFSAEQAEQYGSNMGGGFFSLKDHKDTARVRFLYNDIGDVQGDAVHEVEIEGKKRYVNCLREYNQPVEACPFCEAKMKQLAKVFVQLYNEDTQEVQVWDRGKTFFSLLSGLCARYNPLVSTVFEIERNGKKGDTNTTYMPYAQETDDTTLEDLPEQQELLGNLILDKTFDDMQFFLDTGYFEKEETAQHQQQERRPTQDNRRAAPAQTPPPARRSPAATPPKQPTTQRTPAGNVDQHAPATTTAPAGRRRPQSTTGF